MGPGHLVVLSGPNGRAASALEAARDLHDPRGLSDFEAGLLFLHSIGNALPGLTWRQFVSMTKDRTGYMGHCAWYHPWDCVQNLTSDVKDVVVDTANWVRDSGGDLVRLATDEEVLAAVSRAVTAYASGGTSEALRSALSSFQNLSAEDQAKVTAATGLSREEILAIAGSGASYKSVTVWYKNPWILAAGGTGLVVLGAVFLSKRGANA